MTLEDRPRGWWPFDDGFGCEYDESAGEYTVLWPDGRYLVARPDGTILAGKLSVAGERAQLPVKTTVDAIRNMEQGQ